MRVLENNMWQDVIVISQALWRISLVDDIWRQIKTGAVDVEELLRSNVKGLCLVDRMFDMLVHGDFVGARSQTRCYMEILVTFVRPLDKTYTIVRV